jgi:hypothetical protein
MRDFDKYWKSFGQFEDAITQDPKIENLLKRVALKAFNHCRELDNVRIFEIEAELKEYRMKDES